jgi:hypothetical protein
MRSRGLLLKCLLGGQERTGKVVRRPGAKVVEHKQDVDMMLCNQVQDRAVFLSAIVRHEDGTVL